MNEFEQYEHFNKRVWVRSDLKNRHRSHCLCWACSKFDPVDRNNNCDINNAVDSICVLQDLVLPIWECPKFQEAAKRGGGNSKGTDTYMVSEMWTQ